MKWQRLETAIYFLQSGASMGVVNKRRQSAERLATVELARELHSRMQEWAEPPTRKRKRTEEEEDGGAAEGPLALEEWATRPGKMPKLARTDSDECEESGGTPALAVVAENESHTVTVVTADALEEVRELQKRLVAYQAKLFQGRLFVQSCRAQDFCAAFGGAKEKDSEFFEEHSAIVEDGGLGKAASLVLVAREKESGRVVGYCRADHGDEELRIAQLKVHCDHQRKGVGKLLIQAAETQALRAEWAFESVTARVLHLNSQAQQIFFSFGFDIRDEPAPDPTMSMLSMCVKMIRRAKHVPEPPVEQTIVEPYEPRLSQNSAAFPNPNLKKFRDLAASRARGAESLRAVAPQGPRSRDT
ncbi:MDH2 [Symbiodinium necroappetens]|uniref:MDH2 protein n=1 Tax=Symbiodinium necroappetens TaxID=1628268 RepID=A0A812RL52_9DINO|nr:MDH2 [Symbiodinium necroappetens]